MQISINGQRLDTRRDAVVFQYRDRHAEQLGYSDPAVVYQNDSGVYFLVRRGLDYCKTISVREFEELKASAGRAKPPHPYASAVLNVIKQEAALLSPQAALVGSPRKKEVEQELLYQASFAKIGALCGITGSCARRALRDLEKRGLIVSRKDPKNSQGAMLYSVTEKGDRAQGLETP